jgi:hypothetical protein
MQMGAKGKYVRTYQKGRGKLHQHLPDYLNDLNAMHEAWRTLPPSQKDRFESELYSVVIGEADYNRNDDAPYITNATAAQRAEAFMRTIDKWTTNQNEL